jgi:glycosyltransferase involved in cell wall biosynthesis
MRVLARHNKVLWLNSIGLRTPSLSSKRDLTKMVSKLKSFTQGPVQVAERLWVYTPIVVPLPHTKWAVTVNEHILRRTIGWLRRRLGMDRFQLWTFMPTVAPLVGTLGESLAIYYCTDEFSQFSFLDGEKLARLERRLCERADVVFATARPLWERRRAYNPETHLALHGVDHEHFARALQAETRVAPELAGAAQPILGFFGLIHDWIDLRLLAAVAERRPDWTIALVGKAAVDPGPLAKLPNVKILGRRPYAELPGFCKGFSVGLMPFAINELTRSVNPIKMREYLSAGLPIVSTDLPEARPYAQWCAIARSPEEFVAACDRAIASDTPELRRRRSAAMAGETWEAKVNELGRIVRRVEGRRGQAAAKATPAA